MKSDNRNTKKKESFTPDVGLTVTVRNGNIEGALRIWKKKLKDSGKIEELKARREYIKPSAVKRKKMQKAVRADWQRRQHEE
jgi:small subunit ribosomal protein S21